MGVLTHRITHSFCNALGNTKENNLTQVGGARGVMVIVAGIGHGDTSSNPGLIAFHIALIPLGKV